MIQYIFVLLLFVSVVTSTATNPHPPSFPELTIPQGRLRGKFLTSTKGRTISSFTGIPYAEPPIGNLRFEPPQPARPWSGTLNATNPHPACTQFIIIFSSPGVLTGQEDCLYLNVYTPMTSFRTNNNNKLKPVIVFIHGGGLMLGNANHDSLGPELLLNQDVLLVVPNYRLGPLGFLSTGDRVVPGNNGLKDQNLALKWVKRNIAHFGGDPDRITLGGQSAGGSCVQFHMVSPLSRGLIKGAFAQSGSATSPWVLSANGENQRNSRKLATIFNCPTGNSGEMVRCLKEVDANELTLAQNQLYTWQTYPLGPFKAVVEPSNVDGAMLPKSPIEAVRSGDFAQVPFLTGVNTEDGNFLNPSTFRNASALQDLKDNFDTIAEYLLLYYNTASNEALVTKRVRKFYFGDANFTDSSYKEAGKMFTDRMFFTSVNDMVNLIYKHSERPVYYYAFGYRGIESLCRVLDPTYFDSGVCHFDELIYLLPSKETFPNYQPTDEDKRMSDVMTTMWVNFATTGQPTSNRKLFSNSRWRPVRSDKLEYFRIKSPTDLKMNEGLYSERAQFWRTLPISPDYN